MDSNLAKIELMALQTKVSKYDDTDMFTHFINNGVPEKIILLLQKLWKYTVKLGEKVIEIGKIIFIKLLEFIKENPNLTLGLVLGAFFGTFAGFSEEWVFFDSLRVIFNEISFYALTLLGIVSGSMQDKAEKNGNGQIKVHNELQGFFAVSGEIIGSIKKFLEKLIDIISSLMESFKYEKAN